MYFAGAPGIRIDKCEILIGWLGWRMICVLLTSEPTQGSAHMIVSGFTTEANFLKFDIKFFAVVGVVQVNIIIYKNVVTV